MFYPDKKPYSVTGSEPIYLLSKYSWDYYLVKDAFGDNYIVTHLYTRECYDETCNHKDNNGCMNSIIHISLMKELVKAIERIEKEKGEKEKGEEE